MITLDDLLPTAPGYAQQAPRVGTVVATCGHLTLQGRFAQRLPVTPSTTLGDLVEALRLRAGIPEHAQWRVLLGDFHVAGSFSEDRSRRQWEIPARRSIIDVLGEGGHLVVAWQAPYALCWRCTYYPGS